MSGKWGHQDDIADEAVDAIKHLAIHAPTRKVELAAFAGMPELPEGWTRTFYVHSRKPVNKDAIEWYIIRHDIDTNSPAGLAFALDPEHGWVEYMPGAIATDIRPTVSVDGLTLARTSYLSELEDRVTMRLVDLMTRAGVAAAADWINDIRNDTTGG